MSNLESVVQRMKARNKEVSKFISLAEEEEVTGEFIDCDESEDPKYGMRVNIRMKVNGIVKTLSRPSTLPTFGLLNQMIQLEIGGGDMFRLKRLKNKEKASVYDVVKLSGTSAKASVDDLKTAINYNDISELEKIFKEDEE